jgi:hypothetical protein
MVIYSAGIFYFNKLNSSCLEKAMKNVTPFRCTLYHVSTMVFLYFKMGGADGGVLLANLKI